MKLLSTIFLALLSIAPLAKADRILIYQGSELTETNNSPYPVAGRKHYIKLFDLDTLQSVSIEYGGEIGREYYYSVGAPSAFVYAPITTGATTSQTYFAAGTAATGATFSNSFLAYSGNNLPLTLGGAFTGNYPGILIYVNFARSGDGTIPADTASSGFGNYDLNLGFTRETNNSNDDLPTATAVVTAQLTKSGYIGE